MTSEATPPSAADPPDWDSGPPELDDDDPAAPPDDDAPHSQPPVAAPTLSAEHADGAQRWKVNADARATLESVFLQEPLPSKETIQRLASELNVTARRVQVWFQNRRQRCARKWVNKRSWLPRGARGLSPLLPHPAAAAAAAEAAALDSAGGGHFLPPPAVEMGAREPAGCGSDLLSQPGGSAAGVGSAGAAGLGPSMAQAGGSQCQMLLEASAPHRIMWASTGWLQLTGYMLNQVLGSTLDVFAGPGTDTRAINGLMQQAVERGTEASSVVFHYTQAGHPFQHILKFELLRDGTPQRFLLASCAPLYPQGLSDVVRSPLTNAELMRASAGAGSGFDASIVGGGAPAPKAADARPSEAKLMPPTATGRLSPPPLRIGGGGGGGTRQLPPAAAARTAAGALDTSSDARSGVTSGGGGGGGGASRLLGDAATGGLGASGFESQQMHQLFQQQQQQQRRQGQHSEQDNMNSNFARAFAAQQQGNVIAALAATDQFTDQQRAQFMMALRESQLAQISQMQQQQQQQMRFSQLQMLYQQQVLRTQEEQQQIEQREQRQREQQEQQEQQEQWRAQSQRQHTAAVGGGGCTDSRAASQMAALLAGGGYAPSAQSLAAFSQIQQALNRTAPHGAGLGAAAGNSGDLAAAVQPERGGGGAGAGAARGGGGGAGRSGGGAASCAQGLPHAGLSTAKQACGRLAHGASVEAIGKHALGAAAAHAPSRGVGGGAAPPAVPQMRPGAGVRAGGVPLTPGMMKRGNGSGAPNALPDLDDASVWSWLNSDLPIDVELGG